MFLSVIGLDQQTKLHIRTHTHKQVVSCGALSVQNERSIIKEYRNRKTKAKSLHYVDF